MLTFKLWNFTVQSYWSAKRRPWSILWKHLHLQLLPQKEPWTMLISSISNIFTNYWYVFHKSSLCLWGTVNPYSSGNYFITFDMDFQTVMKLKINLKEKEKVKKKNLPPCRRFCSDYRTVAHGVFEMINTWKTAVLSFVLRLMKY